MTHTIWKLSALLAVLLGPISMLADEQAPFIVEQTGEGCLIKQGEAPVLFYQRQTKALDGQRTRANYVHPLYDLDGNVLTEDFPKDHLHHRGIFWAWHQVWVGDQKIGDPWVCQDFSWDVRDVQTSVDENTASLRALVHWKSPAWIDDAGDQKPFVEETTVIRAHRAEENLRKIDFEIRLLALDENLRIGGSEDDKGYGGFSVRIRLPEGLEFIGDNGPIAPQINPVGASRWLDMTAMFDDASAKSGLAVLCHPSLPGFPQRWILRQSRSMQNPVFPDPGRQAVPISRNEPTILRYRLVVHRGDTQTAGVAELQKQYEEEPLVEFAPASR